MADNKKDQSAYEPTPMETNNPSPTSTWGANEAEKAAWQDKYGDKARKAAADAEKKAAGE